MAKGSGGTRGGGASGPKWADITVTVNEYQMRQGNTLIKFAKADEIEWTDKAKEFIEAESFRKGKTLYENSYHGDSRWVVADSSVMDEHGNWKIGNWDKVKVGSYKQKFNVAKMTDAQFMADETLSKIFNY